MGLQGLDLRFIPNQVQRACPAGAPKGFYPPEAFEGLAMEKVELPCPKHGSHPPYKMRKKWAEKAEMAELPTIRTREAFCPDDIYYSDPLGWWTGHRWQPIPGRDTQKLWCPWNGIAFPAEQLQQVSMEGPKGRALYLQCPACQRPLGKVNRWGLKEPLYVEGQPTPVP